MGACLLIQAAHWSTDVVGGGLLATCVLTAASASRWRQWSEGPPGHDRGRFASGKNAATSLTSVGTVGPDGAAGPQSRFDDAPSAEGSQ